MLSALTGSVLVLTAACGDDDDSVSDEVQDLCDNLGSLNQTVSQVAGADVDPSSTTVGDVQDALSQIQSGVQDVQDAESGLADAVTSALQSAFDGFQSAIQDIPSDDTLADAGDAVESARSQFDQAWNNTLSELQCPAPTPTSS